jgi:hypothetical protein
MMPRRVVAAAIQLGHNADMLVAAEVGSCFFGAPQRVRGWSLVCRYGSNTSCIMPRRCRTVASCSAAAVGSGTRQGQRGHCAALGNQLCAAIGGGSRAELYLDLPLARAAARAAARRRRRGGSRARRARAASSATLAASSPVRLYIGSVAASSSSVAVVGLQPSAICSTGIAQRCAGLKTMAAGWPSRRSH